MHLFTRLGLVAVLLASAAAHAEESAQAEAARRTSAKVRPGLIAEYEARNTRCRGGSGDDPGTRAACSERQRLGREINRLGWCYGEKGQMGYQMAWHPCGPGDERFE